MVYKKIQNEQGNYKNQQNIRFNVLEANEAYTPAGKNVGWDKFENLGEALTAYGLVYDPLSQEVNP